MSVDKEILAALEADCGNRVSTPPPEDDVPYCQQVWDSAACWPATRGGVVATMRCPFMDDSIGDSNATRVCELNGTWRYYADKGGTWSNYSQCFVAPIEDPIAHHEQILRIIYTVGYILSLISLIVAMFIFLYFRKLRCPRNTIHMHFFVSFIFRVIFVFARDIMMNHIYNDEYGSKDYVSPWCKIIFTLNQYFLVTNYYWLLVEGVYLHSLITLAVFSGRTSLRYYFMLGWGCPGLIVLGWATYHIATKTSGCWWENVTTDNSYWIIKAPVMLSILVNFVLFLNITRVLATKLRASNAAEARIYSKLAKSTLVLIPIFGSYYIITVGMHASDNVTVTIVRLYVDLIISPLQGLIMTVLYCFLNGDVQAEIKRKWTVHKINRSLSTNTRSVAATQRSQIHSRSSGSTPPRNDSNDNLANSGDRGERRFSFFGRLLAFKSRLFQTKNPRKCQLNGSVERYHDSPSKRTADEAGATKSPDLPAVCEEPLPTETTRLHQATPEEGGGGGTGEVIVDKTSLSSDEDRLPQDDDSGHVCSGESRSPSLTNGEERDSKKEVHFASNIETEV